jgi:hypothetical protein
MREQALLESHSLCPIEANNLCIRLQSFVECIMFFMWKIYCSVWISVRLNNGGLGWLTVQVCWLSKVVLALRGCCGEVRRRVAHCKGAVPHSEGVVAHSEGAVAHNVRMLRLITARCCSIVVHCVDAVAHNEVWINKGHKA